jgi:heat-inducible transcriptional repressor
MQYISKSGIGSHRPVLREMSERSREIFRLIVDTYMTTGEPVGSRTLSRKLGHLRRPPSAT